MTLSAAFLWLLKITHEKLLTKHTRPRRAGGIKQLSRMFQIGFHGEPAAAGD